MADELAEALAVLDEELTAHAATAWTYRRGASSCTVNVTEGRQRLRVTDQRGGTRIERPDFAGSFHAAELGGLGEPRAGDTLERTFASGLRKFRINAKNIAGEPGWHYTDPQKVRVMVFADHYSGT